MPPKRIIYTAKVLGKDRVLFSILEKSNGELIIPIRTAEKYGNEYDGGVDILEQRYSVHPSLQSTEFTTIKHTTNIADGSQIISVLLTDAIKKNTGFSLIFVRRCHDLSPDKYILSSNDQLRHTIISLLDYDPSISTLYYGVIIGPTNAEFINYDPKITSTVRHFKRFSVIVSSSIYTCPSYYTSEFAHLYTRDPKIAETSFQSIVYRQHMRGKSAQICNIQYMNITYELAKRFFEIMLPTLHDQAVIQNVKNDILGLQQRIIPLAVDAEPPIIHRPTD